MKYLVIILAIAGFVVWWWQSRRTAVRDRLERERKNTPTLLERCPKCGTFAPKEGHTCG